MTRKKSHNWLNNESRKNVIWAKGSWNRLTSWNEASHDSMLQRYVGVGCKFNFDNNDYILFFSLLSTMLKVIWYPLGLSAVCYRPNCQSHFDTNQLTRSETKKIWKWNSRSKVISEMITYFSKHINKLDTWSINLTIEACQIIYSLEVTKFWLTL